MSGVIPWEEPEPKPIPITKEQLEWVLGRMKFYQRSTAYMGLDAEGKIQIYDSEPNSAAAFVHRNDIQKAIDNYGQDNT